MDVPHLPSWVSERKRQSQILDLYPIFLVLFVLDCRGQKETFHKFNVKRLLEVGLLTPQYRGLTRKPGQNEEIEEDDEEEELQNVSVNDYSVVELCNKFPSIRGFGLDISGGLDRPYVRNDYGIFISAIKEHGIAEKSKLIDVGDKVIEVNGHNVEKVNHDEAVTYFKANPGKVVLKIQKHAELLLRAAAATPTPPNSRTPDSEQSESIQREQASNSGYVSIPGFLFGLGLGCIGVFLWKRFLVSPPK